MIHEIGDEFRIEDVEDSDSKITDYILLTVEQIAKIKAILIENSYFVDDFDSMLLLNKA